MGVLSTEGTARMAIYPRRLQQLGLQVLVPTATEFSTLVSPGIALVKAGEVAAASRRLARAAALLRERGARAVILGCTEIPLALRAQLARQPEVFIDSTAALVQAVLASLRTPAADVLSLPRPPLLHRPDPDAARCQPAAPVR